MKEGIHPKYGEVKVTCACGNTFMTGSVKLPAAVSKNSTNVMENNLPTAERKLCCVCIWSLFEGIL